MTGTHRRLRARLYEAVPREWRFGIEVRGSRVEKGALWRADVLAWKGTCAVALEAQVQPDSIRFRSDKYLVTGVWPLWFFLRVPVFLDSATVLDETELSRVPFLLEALSTLPDPTGKRWIDVQEDLTRVLSTARATVLPVPVPQAELDRRKRAAVLSARRRNRISYENGYEEGKAAGWTEAQERFRAAVKGI